ncbi:hypothetical protein [Caballeronia sp. LZ016]|uniref:hypothetical protein n=1 Tax=Caballeronia sp. LZ016 TaxID=3038554 RepID=UPI002859CDDF|nr:hypothetical protein [Caballeronia sp. LZ016]MDR5740751.1 hypothetical protein [Caballeronia sp. LZ016]
MNEFEPRTFERVTSAVAALSLLISSNAIAASAAIRINDLTIHYDEVLKPKCNVFLRSTIGEWRAGSALLSVPCFTYRGSSDDDILRTIRPTDSRRDQFIFRKKDMISLEEMSPREGLPPYRVSFMIQYKVEPPDPEGAVPFFPYDSSRQVVDYLAINADGFELDPKTGTATGYRVFESSGTCYLATDRKPRSYKLFWFWSDASTPRYKGLPSTIDTTTLPWVNVSYENTIAKNVEMPKEVAIDARLPVKPLIYSDYAIRADGRVRKGKAMCMADCPPGMLMKLLHAGQSIWGPSGKPPVTK